jgi:hypothetical protein
VNNQKQFIGNGPEVQTRSLSGGSPFPGESFFGGQYPGIGGNPYSDFAQGGGLPTPFEGGGLTGASNGATSSVSNLLNGLNFTQIKGFVDKMGGVEGIIGAMSKVQKFIGGFQQVAPMLKVLFNSIGSNRAKSSAPVRRRKRRKKSNSYNRKSFKSPKARVSRK